MPYYKYETQSIVENSNYKPYPDSFIITDRNIHSNIPDIVIRNNTIKEAYLIVVSIHNVHNVHSTITEQLQKYNYLQKVFIII
jgi:hypothetical protein